MRRILTLSALLAAFAALSLAESWTGRLVDASCYDQQKSATACDPKPSTTAFALVVSGTAYKLDDTGNTKAIEALKSRADRETNPNNTENMQVAAKVSGTKEGDTIKVETIDVQ